MALNLDVIGKKIGPLTKSYTWRDVVLYALVYFPAIALFFSASLTFTMQSWQQHETYPQSPWMPMIYPLKTVMPITLALLLLQGVAEFLKALWTLRHDLPFRHGE